MWQRLHFAIATFSVSTWPGWGEAGGDDEVMGVEFDLEVVLL